MCMPRAECLRGLLPCILKNCAVGLHHVVVFILNRSFETGSFPFCWRTCFVHSLYKSGDTHLIKNNRGKVRGKVCSGYRDEAIIVACLLI